MRHSDILENESLSRLVSDMESIATRLRIDELKKKIEENKNRQKDDSTTDQQEVK